MRKKGLFMLLALVTSSMFLKLAGITLGFPYVIYMSLFLILCGFLYDLCRDDDDEDIL